MTKPLPTNAQFTKNPLFRRACAAAGTEPTARQAGKFRRKTGIAFTALATLKSQGKAMTCAQLREAILEEQGKIVGLSKMKKADLIERLNSPS